MSGFTAPEYNLARAVRLQLRIIGALMLREMITRFGKENLGYLWLFAEPLILGSALGVIHHTTGHNLPGDLPILMFWVTGYLPFYMFRAVVNGSPYLIVGNQSLLYHRRITILDIIIARHLLEGAAVMGALLLFTLVFGMFLEDWPPEPALVFGGMAATLALSNGLAMALAAGSVFTDLIERVIHLLTYISMPFTGAFFMVFWLPTDLQKMAMWIPTVHCFELVRNGLYGSRVPTHYDLTYLAVWIILLNFLGMLLLRIARRKLVI